jgi:hypothetical protein
MALNKRVIMRLGSPRKGLRDIPLVDRTDAEAWVAEKGIYELASAQETRQIDYMVEQSGLNSS